MKKISLLSVVLMLSIHVFAQDTDEPVKHRGDHPPKKEVEKPKILRPLRYPSFYINTSTGINNNTGLLGLSFDVPVAKYFSVEAGAGISTWGYKFAALGKYYLQPGHRGWAFGAGITHSTGLQNTQQNLQTVDGNTEEVGLNLNPQTNVFLAAYRYWNLGKRYNRFFLELGWSIPVSGGDKFDQVSGTQITSTSVSTMNLLSPGGLIIGAGFSFGVY